MSHFVISLLASRDPRKAESQPWAQSSLPQKQYKPLEVPERGTHAAMPLVTKVIWASAVTGVALAGAWPAGVRPASQPQCPLCSDAQLSCLIRSVTELRLVNVIILSDSL